jgi:serine/threonine-protein kinase
MWEAIVGARMWGETGEALMMSKILEGEIPPPRSIKPELPDELERICMKALAYDPAERYQTAADMQLDIEEYLSRAGTLVAQRDIGAFVNESFRDIFEQTQRVIEKSQAEPMTVAGSEIIYFPPSLASAAVTLTASRTQTQLRTNRLPVFAVAGLGLLVLALVIALVLARRGESSRMADAAAAAASARASEEPKTVQFRVTAFPAGAQLFLDGVPLPSNPFSEARPKDADPHVVRAELAGHKPRAVSVSFQRDSDIVLYLEREVPEARADAGAELPKSRGGVGRTKQRDPAKAEPTAPSRRDYGF